MNDLAQRLESYFDRLWPICRSITGPGYRESLNIISEVIPTKRLQFATGLSVLDWEVPKEWDVRDAYFIDPTGKRRCEFTKNNLHLLNYSAPFQGRVPFSTLKQHCHTLPDQPTAIPYLTSYYKERWGFCLSQQELDSLPDGEYEVVIETVLRNGFVEIGEAILPGESSDEIFFSSYLCHPSLANNELSGPLALMFIYELLAKLPQRRFTYRFVILPETIGSICYLSTYGDHLRKQMIAGFLLTCVGDGGKFTLKHSRRGNSLADRVAPLILREFGEFRVVPFDPVNGSDDRQYCSPGFNLPVVSIMRTMYNEFPEYHTSLDNKSIMNFQLMAKTVEACFDMTRALEVNHRWVNTCPFGEPQLGKRGLYPTLGSQKTTESQVRTRMWALNLADGKNDLLSMAEKAGVSPLELNQVAEELRDHGLFRRLKEGESL